MKYTVTVQLTVNVPVQIEADDKGEACDVAHQEFWNILNGCIYQDEIQQGSDTREVIAVESGWQQSIFGGKDGTQRSASLER